MINATAKQQETIQLENFLTAIRTSKLAEGDAISIFLPECLSPLERYQRYEVPLGNLVAEEGLGYVGGGGSWLDQSGLIRSGVTSCDVSVVVTDVARALTSLRTALPKLGCPTGTQLQYELGERLVFDEYDGCRWTPVMPETDFAFGRSLTT